jgi:hypothetical protein
MKEKIKNQKGFIQIPILIAIMAGVLVLGGGGYFSIKQYHNYQVANNKKVDDSEVNIKLQDTITKLKPAPAVSNDAVKLTPSQDQQAQLPPPNSILCNGAYWTACPIGQTFSCPAVGNATCILPIPIPKGTLCNGKYWLDCPTGQTFSCPATGAVCLLPKTTQGETTQDNSALKIAKCQAKRDADYSNFVSKADQLIANRVQEMEKETRTQDIALQEEANRRAVDFTGLEGLSPQEKLAVIKGNVGALESTRLSYLRDREKLIAQIKAGVTQFYSQAKSVANNEYSQCVNK